MKKIQILFIIFISIIIFLSFFTTLFPINKSHYWDEAAYLQNAEYIFSAKTNYSEYSHRPPLISLLFILSYFFYHSYISAHVVTSLLAVGFPLFLFLIGYRLYNIETGILAAFTVIFTRFFIFNSNDLLTDIPMVSLLAGSFYFFLFPSKKYFILISGLLLAAAILTKFTAILAIPIFASFYFLYKEKNYSIKFFTIGFSIIFLPYLLWTIIAYRIPLWPFIKGASLVTDKYNSTFYYFTELPNIFSYITLVGFILWIPLMIYRYWKKGLKNIRLDIFLLIWFVVFMGYLTKLPHKELRYITPALIPFVIISSKEIILLLKKIKKPYKNLLLTIIILFLLVQIYPTYLWLGDNLFKIDHTLSTEQETSDYIVDDLQYTGLIYLNRNYPVYGYYTYSEIRPLWPQDESFYEVYPENMESSGIIIISTQEKHPTKNWLDENDNFIFIESFDDLYIYQYLIKEN